MTRALRVAVLLLASATTGFAQDDGGSKVIQRQRVPYVEMIVVAALCGAAVFVVCRSSRRN